MDRHGLTFDDLVEAGCFAEAQPDEGDEPDAPSAPAAGAAEAATLPAAPKPAKPLYRNALGQSWDGTGERPEWLQRAVNAGQSVDFFRVE